MYDKALFNDKAIALLPAFYLFTKTKVGKSRSTAKEFTSL